MTARRAPGRPHPAAPWPARSVGRDRHAVAPRRPAVAHDRDDRGRAGPRRAAADPAGRPVERRRRARRADPGRPRSAAAIIVVTGCGTSEHGAQASVEILRDAMRTAGLPWRLGEGGAPVAAQAFEASLEDELGAGGLVIGISHEGATWATNRALERARSSGAPSGSSPSAIARPARQQADVVVATEELDQSWCHTIGYLAPILAATAVGAHLSGRPVDPAAVRDLLAAGLRADAVAAIERLAAALAAARADHRHRVRRRPRGRARARAQARGGHPPPGDGARPRDHAPRPPRRHGRPHRPRAHRRGRGERRDARRSRAAGALRAAAAIGCVIGVIAGPALPGRARGAAAGRAARPTAPGCRERSPRWSARPCRSSC